MSSELVENWFGDEFHHLHPLLQQLHINGGKLAGDLDISHDDEGLHRVRRPEDQRGYLS